MVAFLEVGFFPRIHTAIAEWLACMLFILPQKKRFGESSWQQIGCCIGFLALLLGLNLLNQEQSGLTWMLLMAACMGTMLAMIVCCCKLKLMKAGYIWAHAFITAEFAASLEWQINYYLLMADSVDSRGTWLVMAGTYIIVFSAIYLLNQKHHILRSGTSVTRQELISGSAIALASFCLSNFNFAFTNNVFTETLGTGIIYSRTLVDFGGVIMLFAYDMARSELYLSHELEAMENLLNRQYEQYRQFDANNKAMHQIYHDLKHQIDFIRNEKSASKRESYLAEMEKVVTLRDAEMNTGNAILDTVLTSKSLRCAEEGKQGEPRLRHQEHPQSRGEIRRLHDAGAAGRLVYHDGADSAGGGKKVNQKTRLVKRRNSASSRGFFMHLVEVNPLILARTEAKLRRAFDGVDAVAALDALQHVFLPRVVRRGVHHVHAGLVDGNRVERRHDANVRHAGVFRHCAAVAVHRQVLHLMEMKLNASEALGDGRGRVRH